MEAERDASRVRMELMAQREEVMVPQSPGVRLAMWISQPASFRRKSVPAQRNSASSGWARMESAILEGSVFTKANCRRIARRKQRLFAHVRSVSREGEAPAEP